jgi:prepilin-type N-terminal cleavage/methylation domain-containing protein
MTTKAKQGFTLIEILIVVAIIAILASVVLIGLGPTQQAGRDARRLSDLRQVQNGLELYYNKCGYYPGDTQAGAACGAHVATTGYGIPGAASPKLVGALPATLVGVSSLPNDPTSGKHYWYTTDAAGTIYLLETQLENANNSIFTSYTAPNGLASYTTGDGVQNACTGLGWYCITL